ncbi:Protein ENHANCED DISEASE RESISTANCE 2 [Striga hermonthica]|uniref:Protein ENHANCED DISEASE RESISTANCE 2 n=1 Tax=Striga hermonthica TaxID=68872 RepID=A0A9N7NXD4_STRHE|nr:Protein ENHANCED DISEASE RESISTANCE 2 [Striga hermonthica]
MSNSKVVYEGWMVRYGRRKIGRSFIHMRYFVLESRLLAYYKKKPQGSVVPVNTLVIDGNCRVEDRGLKTHHGHMIYVLSVYNKKDICDGMTMAAFNIQESLMWKEKIESVIDQHQESQATDGSNYHSFEYESGVDNEKNVSSSDNESQFSAAEDEELSKSNSMRRTTIGNGSSPPPLPSCFAANYSYYFLLAGPPKSVFDWSKEFDSYLPNESSNNHSFSGKYWRLLQCQNGLRIFEELLEVDFLPRSCSRAMKAVGVVEATCEEVFELVMSMDAARCEWDCSFQYGSLVEEVDGHTAILYHRLQLDWFPTFVWPRDLCYLRYWRRNDDGSYGTFFFSKTFCFCIWRALNFETHFSCAVVLFRSREHKNCGPQRGFVRAHIESGGFNISPMKPRGGSPRTQVQHLMQIDLKGWGVGYMSSFQQHCLLQMLNSVAGLREYFSQTDERPVASRIPVMINMTSISNSSKSQSPRLSSVDHQNGTVDDQMHAANRHSVLMDEYSDEDEDFQCADQEVRKKKKTKLQCFGKYEASEEEPQEQVDVSIFSGNIRRDDQDNARDCYTLSDGNNFRVRGKNFCQDKSKTPGGKHLMDLVSVDWFKDTKRMDHVARRNGCAAQVASEKGLFSIVFNLQIPGSTHYSMVFYFVAKEIVSGSLLQRFVDGDDDFRNSRLKLIPSVPKGSWIVRQSVGSSACLLGKSVDCNYIRGANYLEVDVDIGSSTVAKGVLGLVIGVIKTLVVDMAFLVQGNTPEELPERVIGAVRICHLELSSAVEPMLNPEPSDPPKP